MNKGVLGEHGDELPDEMNLDPGSSTPIFRAGLTDEIIQIPDEVSNEEDILRNIPKYGRRVIKNAGGINILLLEYHKEYGDTTFQEYLQTKLGIGINYADELAKIIAGIEDEDEDENDIGVEELDPSNMTF